ncbi:MAG: alanyl-tRNA editing protein, partial [Desulfomonilia bacterium]|nr:alanyl-tRNA editing protein [Desulfomonilia bacterium]
MPVEKLFWQDPYLTEIDARITSCRGNRVTLDRTIFYAASGGQESDTGTIGDLLVARAEKGGLEIFYTLQGPHSFTTGDRVTVRIDWERRSRLMRLHFAAEIILELVYQHLNMPVKIGANISSDKARIDFSWEGRISDAFPLLEAEAKRIVDEDAPIRSDFSDLAREERFWEIE